MVGGALELPEELLDEPDTTVPLELEELLDVEELVELVPELEVVDELVPELLELELLLEELLELDEELLLVVRTA